MGDDSSRIEAGTRVVIIDASRNEHEVTALGPVVAGHSMAVVWVKCPLFDRGFVAMPWPAEYVRPVVPGLTKEAT